MKTTKHASIKSEGDNVGIYVGKDNFDICIYEQELDWKESNSEIGIRRLMKRLSRYHVTRLLVRPQAGMNELWSKLQSSIVFQSSSFSQPRYASSPRLRVFLQKRIRSMPD